MKTDNSKYFKNQLTYAYDYPLSKESAKGKYISGRKKECGDIRLFVYHIVKSEMSNNGHVTNYFELDDIHLNEMNDYEIDLGLTERDENKYDSDFYKYVFVKNSKEYEFNLKLKQIHDSEVSVVYKIKEMSNLIQNYKNG